MSRRTIRAICSALLLPLAACGGATHHLAARSPSPSPSPTPSSASPAAPPPTCPLTGAPAPGGTVPQRPALGVKVENLPAARPQTGLNTADIVYEEPVEDMITRFLAIYQCQGAERIEPIRSGRLVDPDLLLPLRSVALAYAGAIDPVMQKIANVGITDLNFIKDAPAYHRDPNRAAPHNLYSSTRELWALTSGRPPRPLFTYSAQPPAGGAPASYVHVPYRYSDVYWRYDAAHHRYLRSYGSDPALLSDGATIDTTNVVVEVVQLSVSPYVEDPTGIHENEVHTVGSGPAYVLRDGVVIRGTWRRNSVTDVTQFLDPHGQVIPLAPGRTWVELDPTSEPATVG